MNNRPELPTIGVQWFIGIGASWFLLTLIANFAPAFGLALALLLAMGVTYKWGELALAQLAIAQKG